MTGVRSTELSSEYLWSSGESALFSAHGRFDPWLLSWTQAPSPGDAAAVTPLEALARLRPGGRLRRVPIGVIGPREASAREREVAEELGRALAEHGLQLLCGGKNGVMEAACKGHAEAGGLPIGLIPDPEWDAANPYCAVPIATGIGPARNAIIARACLVLIAVGGGYGTLSEMAFGLQFERLVLALETAPKVDGAIVCTSVGEVLGHVAERILTSSPAVS